MRAGDEFEPTPPPDGSPWRARALAALLALCVLLLAGAWGLRQVRAWQARFEEAREGALRATQADCLGDWWRCDDGQVWRQAPRAPGVCGWQPQRACTSACALPGESMLAYADLDVEAVVARLCGEVSPPHVREPAWASDDARCALPLRCAEGSVGRCREPSVRCVLGCATGAALPPELERVDASQLAQLVCRAAP